MLLQFDIEDIPVLDEVLSQHLRTLLNEIAHADDRAFRDDLRRRYEHVETIRRRLTSPPAAQTVASA